MNTPTFTPEPPTKPGWYLWKCDEVSNDVIACSVERSGDKMWVSIRDECYQVTAWGGLWCRLVPAEEVERTYREAVESYYDSPYPSPTADDLWQTSRAKRVMEGEV